MTRSTEVGSAYCQLEQPVVLEGELMVGAKGRLAQRHAETESYVRRLC